MQIKMHDPIDLTTRLILPGLLEQIKNGRRNDKETKAAAIFTYIQVLKTEYSSKTHSMTPCRWGGTDGEDNLNFSVGKNVRNAPQKPQSQDVKLAKQNLKKKTLVFPIDTSDLAILLSAISIQNLYKPHHCGFMEKSQEYGMT